MNSLRGGGECGCRWRIGRGADLQQDGVVPWILQHNQVTGLRGAEAGRFDPGHDLSPSVFAG